MIKKYQKYKESGVEWIGAIPEEWKVNKVKHKCYVKGRVGWKGLTTSEFLYEGYSYLVTGTDFKNDKIDWNNCYHIDKVRYEEDPYIQLKNEDLLITKDGTIGKLAIVSSLDKPACLNSGIFVVRSLSQDFSTRYLFWVLKSNLFTQFNSYTSYGSTIQHLYQNVFLEFAFSFPTLHEQRGIAYFLDRKIAEIDRLIANKERLINLYEEEKAVIIYQAVTKGIYPDVKLKPSYIEWLGDIPVHWGITRINYKIRVKDGTHDTPRYVPDNGINFPLITSKDFINDDIDFLNAKFISPEDHNNIMKRSNTEIGDIIMSMIGGNIGNLVLVKTDREFSIKNVALFKTSHNAVIGKYLYYILKSVLLKIQIDQNARGGAQGFISLGDLRGLIYFILPFEEMKSIVEHIESECSRLDTIIEKFAKQIELFKEYRTTLISEVVAGKIDVRDEVEL